MKILPAMIGGLFGGALAAAVWAACVYFFEVEIGWIAWGVGVFVGIGVRVGVDRTEVGPGLGLLSAMIAILAILAGKFAAAELLFDQVTPEARKMGQMMAEMSSAERESFHRLIQMVSPEDAKNIQEGFQELDMMSPEERSQLNMLLSSDGYAYRWEAFKSTFSPIDCLWFFLAVSSAYRIAVDPESEDKEPSAKPAESPA